MPASARPVSAIFFQAPADAPSEVFLHHGTGTVTLPLPRMNLGQSIKLPAGDLVLYFTPKPVGKLEVVPPEAPTASIPAAWSEVILLFSYSPQTPEFPFKVTPLNASMGEFRPGEMLIFNRSKSTVGGILGGQRVRINPGASTKVPPPVANDSDYPVRLAYSPANCSETLPLADTTWRHESAIRQLLFIVPDASRGVPRVWSVPAPMQR